MSSKFLKTVILSLSLIAALIPADANAAAGEKTFGVKTGYVSRNTSALAGLFFQYSFSDHFRIAPDAEVVFRHKDRDAFIVDLDCQFPFKFAQDGKTSLYPIAGLNYSSWNRHMTKVEEDQTKDVSSRSGKFGLNLGAGFDLKCSSTLKLSLEARYSLVKSNSSVQISAGIGYIF